MPFDTIMLCTAVVLMFAAFAGVLIWGDLQTPRQQPVRLPTDRH
jgi:hypothetical protein